MREGRRIAITASPTDVYAPYLTRALGFEAVVGSTLEVDANGVYTGRVTTHMEGASKARVVRDTEVKGQTVGYGDTHYDLPLLESVDTPIAVHPDAKLSAHAQRKKWTIYASPVIQRQIL